MSAESDAEIIRKTLNGNRHAFEALILRYNRMAYAVAFARLGSHHDAEDAVQEGWLQAFATLNRLRDPDRFPAWLAAIVRNVSVNAGRNRWRRHSLEEVGDTLMVDFREGMEDADLHRALWAQIATMTSDYREVLTLHYHAGLSTEEIADWTGLSRETVKKRLQRARSALSEQTLHTLLEPAEQEEDRRRKRVMALLLLIPVDWKATEPPAEGFTPPKHAAFPEHEPANPLLWMCLALALAAGTALLLFAGYWFRSSNSDTPRPSAVSVSPPISPVPSNAGGVNTKGSPPTLFPPPPAPAPFAKGGKG